MKKLRCTIFNFLGILLVHLICNLTFKFFNNNKWRKYLACTHIRSIPDKGFDPEQIMLKDLLSPWRRKDFSFIHFSVHHFLSPFLFYDLALSLLYDVSPLVWFLMWLTQKMFFFRPTFGHFSKSCGFQKNKVVWKLSF